MVKLWRFRENKFSKKRSFQITSNMRYFSSFFLTKMDEMVRVEKGIKEKIIFKTELENFRKQTPLLC